MQRPERERKEPTEFNVIVKAKDLVKHTFTITNSTERYPKKYRFTLVNRIQDKAVDIYECVLEANELDLRDAQEYRQRQKLQAKALTYCKELLFFIELSQEMGFISMNSCEYWSKLALKHGVDFLGFHTYLTESGAVIRKVRRRSKNNMKRKLKKLAALHAAGRIDAKTVEQSYQSWRGHAEKGNSYHLIRRTDQYYNSLMKSKEAAQCQKH